MKQFRFSALLLLVVLITASCKKIPVIEKGNSYISYKLDGKLKEAKGPKNVLAYYIKEQNFLQIIGNAGGIPGEQGLGLMISDFHGVGDYILNEDTSDFIAFYNTQDINVSIMGTEGKIKITEYIPGKSIKGEFYFKGEPFIIDVGQGDDTPKDVKVFSEGKFEMKISAFTPPPGTFPG